MARFVVIESSGLNSTFCNTSAEVEADGPVEAAILASGCPIPMQITSLHLPDRHWEVMDEVSCKGWGPNTCPDEQWIVTVVQVA